MTKYRLYIKFFNEPTDLEKVVTPAIVYIKKPFSKGCVYWIGIGWWHYGIYFALKIIR